MMLAADRLDANDKELSEGSAEEGGQEASQVQQLLALLLLKMESVLFRT